MVNVGWWRAGLIWAAAWVGAGCVGGKGNAPDGGVGGTGGCFECQPGCFDCGGGCQCLDGSVPPDASTWVSPFPATGDDGTWRDSTERFCVGPNHLGAIDVWSDARGVYALIAGGVLGEMDQGGADAEEPGPGGFSGGTAGAGGIGTGGAGGFAGIGGIGGIGPIGCTANDCFGEAILFNDGAQGWQRILENQAAANFEQRHLSGVPGGSLMIWGTATRFVGGELCAFERVSPSTGEVICDRASGAPTALLPVNETLAFAALGTDVIRFDGTAWSVYGPAAPAAIVGLWANETDMAVVTVTSEVLVLRDNAWSATGATGVAVWGSSSDDLWIMTSFGVLTHHDGNMTTTVAELNPQGCGQVPLISSIWGSGDTLYLYGPRTLLRWNGSTIDTLGEWTCDFNQSAAITRVWGNGPSEVFIAMTDFNRPFTDPACGNGIVMYFDGSEFHAL